MTITSSCLTDIQSLLFCHHRWVVGFQAPGMEELNLINGSKSSGPYSPHLILSENGGQPISNQVCTTFPGLWCEGRVRYHCFTQITVPSHHHSQPLELHTVTVCCWGRCLSPSALYLPQHLIPRITSGMAEP